MQTNFIKKYVRISLFVEAYSEDDEERFFKALEDGDYDEVEKLFILYPNIVYSKAINGTYSGNKYHTRNKLSVE